MRVALATLALCLLLTGCWPYRAQASEPPDGNRYPGWGNRMTGYQDAKEPRWAIKRKRVVRQYARRKPTRVTRARPIRVHVAKSPGARLVSDAAEAFTTPARFIRGRLICAVNVGAALAARGIRGTGSALAKSYLNWGRPSGPVPGAVAVFNRGRRGGHVAIVHSVKPNGTVVYLNPSARRQTWVVGPYRKRPIAYRVASN